MYKEDFLLLTGYMVAFLIIVCLATFLGLEYNRIKCSDYEKLTGRNTDFTYTTGCVITTEFGKFTQDEYKQILMAKEGLSR